MKIPGMIEVMVIDDSESVEGHSLRTSFNVNEIAAVMQIKPEAAKKTKCLLLIKGFEGPLELTTSYEVVMQLILNSKKTDFS